MLHLRHIVSPDYDDGHGLLIHHERDTGEEYASGEELHARSRRRFITPIMHRVMGVMKRMMPEDARRENVRAVRMLRRVDTLRDLFKAGPVRRMIGRLSGNERWPVTTGTYIVGDRSGSVAVCALTSAELIAPLAAVPGVAIAGNVITPNLGIEKIIRNLTANPRIRFLLLCGQESAVFHPAQALGALLYEWCGRRAADHRRDGTPTDAGKCAARTH